ncbi:hypothetical protein [Sporomusa malonica]|nr:hypothetical protein [Sporomusa malonica]
MSAVATLIPAVLLWPDGTSVFVAGVEKYFINGLLQRCYTNDQ